MVELHLAYILDVQRVDRVTHLVRKSHINQRQQPLLSQLLVVQNHVGNVDYLQDFLAQETSNFDLNEFGVAAIVGRLKFHDEDAVVKLTWVHTEEIHQTVFGRLKIVNLLELVDGLEVFGHAQLVLARRRYVIEPTDLAKYFLLQDFSISNHLRIELAFVDFGAFVHYF